MHHPSFHARETPDKIAYQMSASGDAITYRELDERSNQGAHLFRALGLRPGDHIALLMENSLPFLEICWAAQRSGLYFTAISRYLTPAEIAYIVDDCGARVLIVSPSYAEKSQGPATRGRSGPVLFTTGAPQAGFRSWRDSVGSQPTTPVPDEVAGYDMLYSSGTTGRPKGVKPAFKNGPIDVPNPLLLALCRDMCGMTSRSIYLSPAPLYHAAPLRFSMMMAALGGTTIVMERFEPEAYLRCVAQYGVTHTQLVPTMFVRLLKLPDDIRRRYAHSTLQSVIHAAAPCPVDVKAQMIAWWGPILIEYYAGTEGNGVTIINSHEWLSHRGSVGRAFVGKLEILDDDDNPLPVGAVGTVYFADGPQFAYHNDPEKTKNAFNSRGASTLGDVGRVDEEGFLYLTDRKAYMIISGGVNIYPQETEDVLIAHPAVADVAVFGIPNEEMGEEVKAVVEPQDGARAGADLEIELIAYCRSRLSPLKCPRSVDFEASLPRTPTGKLMKRHLRDRYWKAAAAAIAPKPAIE